MAKATKALYSEAIKDPEHIYDTPQDVMSDRRLSPEEKKKILESWALDMEGLLRAEEENMTKLKNKPRYDAQERLRDIQKQQRLLEGKA